MGGAPAKESSAAASGEENEWSSSSGTVMERGAGAWGLGSWGGGGAAAEEGQDALPSMSAEPRQPGGKEGRGSLGNSGAPVRGETKEMEDMAGGEERRVL